MEKRPFKRSLNITATVLCLLCSLPQQCIAAIVPVEKLAVTLATYERPIFPTGAMCILPQVTDPIEAKLMDLAETIQGAIDPLQTTREFFDAFLNQINMQNGTSLTIEDACKMLRQNPNLVPVEFREIFQKAIDSIESGQLVSMDFHFYWPWEWNWFGLNKNTEKNSAKIEMLSCEKPQPPTWVVVAIVALAIAALAAVAIYNAAALPAAADAIVKVMGVVL